MTIELTYEELSAIIADKTGRIVTFTYVNRSTVRLTTPVKILLAKVTVSVNITVESIDSPVVNLSYDGNFGVDMIAGGALSLLKSKIPELSTVIEAFPGKKVAIDLSKLKHTASVVSRLSPRTVEFGERSVTLTATLLPSPAPLPSD